MPVKLVSYQRFVKTTPKPSATKNSSGELVGLLALLAGLVVGPARADVVRDGAEALEVGAALKCQERHKTSDCQGRRYLSRGHLAYVVLHLESSSPVQP